MAITSEKRKVNPTDIVEADVDMAMANDITAPLAVEAFRKIGVEKVWNTDKIVVVLDHQVPADTVRAAELHKMLREFVKDQGIKNFYDVGQGGVCHQVMVEKGHVCPGDLIVGADSHTCTYGGLGAFSTGIGSTEIAAVFVTGKLWFRVPEVIRMNISGEFQKHVAPKDLILEIVGRIGADGAIYKGLEFFGPTITDMSIGGRMTLCNMAVEMVAKTGLIEPDKKTLNYVKKRTEKRFNPLRADVDADYEKTENLDVSDLEPRVSCPPSVDNVKPISEIGDVTINQAFVGSCTNGRFEDIQVTSNLLGDKKVKEGVRMLVAPASQEVYIKALREGLLENIVKAGAYVCNPTCGPCFGGYIGLLAAGEVCVSSSNRNFVGRMGSPKADVYLASPATVTASAITGKITDPRTVEA